MEQTKKCFKCNKIKPAIDFYKHVGMADGRLKKCKECTKVDVKQNYVNSIEEKRKYDQYRHRHSISRIFNHRYSGIKSRCMSGRSNGKSYKVTGQEFLSKEEWISWCYEKDNYKKFIEIYNNWVKNDFEEKLSPSIDRIDNKKSYVLGNLQWLSKSENCSKYNK